MKALLHRKYLPFLTTPSDRIFRGFFYQFHHPTLYARMVSLSLSSAIAFFISLYLTFCQSLSHLNRRLSLISCSRAIRATEAPGCKTSLTIWSLTHLKMICGVLRIMFLLHNRRPPVWKGGHLRYQYWLNGYIRRSVLTVKRHNQTLLILQWTALLPSLVTAQTLTFKKNRMVNKLHELQ